MSLVSRLLRNYRYVFADLSTERAASMPGLLHLPCICLLVSNASLASARDISRWRALIGRDTADRKTLHILNKVGASSGGLPVAEFERATGRAPDIVIHYDRDVAQSSSLGIRELEKCGSFFRALTRASGDLRRAGRVQSVRFYLGFSADDDFVFWREIHGDRPSTAPGPPETVAPGGGRSRIGIRRPDQNDGLHPRPDPHADRALHCGPHEPGRVAPRVDELVSQGRRPAPPASQRDWNNAPSPPGL